MCLCANEISNYQSILEGYLKKLVNHYIIWPDSFFRLWKFSILNSFSFAECLRCYKIVWNSKNKENDYQPEWPTGRPVDTVGARGAAGPYRHHFLEQNFFLRKIGVDKREGVHKKMTKNDKNRKMCNQKNDVLRTNCFSCFFL